MFVGLQDTGKLLRICSHTLWRVSANDEHVFKDFTVVQSSSGGYNVLAVTKENEDGVSNVQLISNPGKFGLLILYIIIKANLIVIFMNVQCVS